MTSTRLAAKITQNKITDRMSRILNGCKSRSKRNPVSNTPDTTKKQTWPQHQKQREVRQSMQRRWSLVWQHDKKQTRPKRPEARRVGKKWVSTITYQWSPYLYKTKKKSQDNQLIR